MNVPPKTSWCQSCIEEHDELILRYDAKKQRYNWLCRRCVDAEAGKKESKLKFNPDEHYAEARRSQKAALPFRVLEPGEQLPEGRADFGFGSSGFGNYESPYMLYGGLLQFKKSER